MSGLRYFPMVGCVHLWGIMRRVCVCARECVNSLFLFESYQRWYASANRSSDDDSGRFIVVGLEWTWPDPGPFFIYFVDLRVHNWSVSVFKANIPVPGNVDPGGVSRLRLFGTREITSRL